MRQVGLDQEIDILEADEFECLVNTRRVVCAEESVSVGAFLTCLYFTKYWVL